MRSFAILASGFLAACSPALDIAYDPGADLAAARVPLPETPQRPERIEGIWVG